MYQNFHIDVIKLIFIKYSISDLYRNDPGSGKSLQRASNLRQGKFESRFVHKLYRILIQRYTNQLRIQINVYNYHLT